MNGESHVNESECFCPFSVEKNKAREVRRYSESQHKQPGPGEEDCRVQVLLEGVLYYLQGGGDGPGLLYDL